ncbi:MAG: GAF domain-containing protein [Nitrospirae bacterium]|nr:GAF domain-containing protein [Nitrospirota bacterium]
MSKIEEPAVLDFIKYPANIRKHNNSSHKRIDCLLPTKLIVDDLGVEGLIINISKGGCNILVKDISGAIAPSPFNAEHINKDIILSLMPFDGLNARIVSAYKINIENYLGIKFITHDNKIEEKLDYYIQAVEKTDTSAFFQTAINSILKVLTKNIPFVEQLNYILTIILSIPNFTNQTRGAIYLIEDDPQLLVMKVQIGIPKLHIEDCSTVEIGKCYCGMCAKTGEIISGSSDDTRHDIRHADDEIHGHFCVPIKNYEKIFGIISLYLRSEYKINHNEEEFLVSVANILALIMHNISK